MADLNSISVTGRLGADSEMRYTPDGTAILSFNLGNGIYKKGAGQYNTQTTWYKCTVFGTRAESLNNLGALVKGARVGVTGQHSMRPWTDKDGNERLSCEIGNCEVVLMDSKSNGDSTPDTKPAAPARNAPQQTTEEDLPF